VLKFAYINTGLLTDERYGEPVYNGASPGEPSQVKIL